MNEPFDKIRRDPLLPEHHYREKLALFEDHLVSPKVAQLLAAPEKFPGHKQQLMWGQVGDALRLLIARYSAGEDISSLKPYAVRAFEWFKRYHEDDGDQLKLWERDAYQYTMWLLSLAVLLGLKEWVSTIATWVSANPEDGQDLLVSRLFGRLGVSLPGESLIHENPYADLLHVTETRDEAQQRAMADYLKRWYGGMKDCYWYDRHKRLNAFFFGYWAFEAGLVTLLWNIDDSGYRDKRFYPKDLVDFAREHSAHTRGETPKPHISRKTGEQCPHAGRWGVLESPGAFVQERFFREGDTFPEGIGRGGKEGPVTWVVMGREDGGPTRME